ncbi:unnamed protein product, partial [Mesorhabditis belari]|uniref:Prenyltransferase alpha-alpha toroid domain-containing protein n=1 Tax=Mesorhabditis belari TaxID=2138241 RepID=A0AAF3EZR8_9BILA
MPFRKYRAVTAFSKNDTRIFKQIYQGRLKLKVPMFKTPESIKALDVQILDPNDADFVHKLRSRGTELLEAPKTVASASFFKKSLVQDHPLYQAKKAYIFEGIEPFCDGMSQASTLTHSVLIEGLPLDIQTKAQKFDISEEKVRDAILHAEKYDPSLDKLPRRHDPVIFWVTHPRVHGTPVVKRNNILLDNLHRHLLYAMITKGTVRAEQFKLDRDEFLSAKVSSGRFSSSPLVIRSQPHLAIQTTNATEAWAKGEKLKEILKQPVLSCHPIDPIIDLKLDNIYNNEPLLPRKEHSLHLNTLMWTREQDQKYPWTKEQNAANAIMQTFGAAVAQARRMNLEEKDIEKPILIKGVQLVDGKLDLVAVQLNTLDLRPENAHKNVIWIEKGVRLYRPKPFYEQLKTVDELDLETETSLLMCDQLQTRKHIRYLVRHLNIFPNNYSSLDTTKITLFYFAISGLDLLGELDASLKEGGRKRCIDWIYSMQLTSQSANYGLCDSGVRGFGAIAFDERRRENRWIVQHNLSTFWKRDELVGERITFPTPLVPPRSISAKWRLPEHFFYDQTEVQLINRNLLAARQVQDGTAQMWTVSERSNQKTLELFTLNTKRDFVTLDPEQASTSSVLPAAARQLKTATDRMNGDLWIRTMASLYLKTRDDQFTQIFRGAISTFHENPFFEEVIICDGRDFVWIGQPGNSFTRVKNTFGTASKKLASTSHPRILFSADEHSLRLLDVRNDSPQTAVPLYQLDDWQKITSLSSKDFLSQIDTAEEPQLLFNKPRILHVLPMQASERFCMLVTTKHLIVIDSRIPGQPIFTFGHGIEGLIHHIETCPPWRDPVEGGSTLQPPKVCRMPGDFLHLVREDISGESYQHLFSPTRSIAIVSEYGESDSCIILTALDDGSLWSQRQTHQKTSTKETEKLFSASVKLVKKYVRSNRYQPDPSFADLPDELCPSRKDLLMTVPVDQVTSKKKFRKPKQHYDLDQVMQTMDRTNLNSSAEKEEVRSTETIALIDKETNEQRINTRMTLDILQGEPIASISHLLSWEEFDAQGLLQSNTTTTRLALLDIQEENEDEEMMDELRR